MPKFPDTSTIDFKKSVRNNPCDLYPHIERGTGYSNITGLPFTVYRVNPEKRCLLVPDEVKAKIRMDKIWTVSRFDLTSPEVQAKSVCERMKAAIYEPKNCWSLSISIVDETGKKRNIRNLIQWNESPREAMQPGKKTDHTHAARLSLSPPARQHEGYVAGIYNHRTEPVILLPGLGQSITIPAGEGVVLKAVSAAQERVEWILEASYKHQERRIQTNPLVSDEPLKSLEKGVFLDKKQCISGEYFLPPEVIEWLIAEESPDGKVPVVLRLEGASVRAGQKALVQALAEHRKSEKGSLGFFAFDENSNHMVSVRYLPMPDNNIVVYIHETLGAEHAVAKTIKDGVLVAVRKQHKGNKIVCIMPEKGIQVDLASCGIFSFQAYKAFYKENLDLWLKSLYEKLRSELSDKAVISHCLPLSEMPGVLLKGMQSGRDSLTDDQMNTIVSHKKGLLLKNHLSLHTPDHLGGGNVYAMGKRYQKMLQWEPFLMQKQMAEKFSPLLSCETRASANAYLESEYGVSESEGVSENDWDMICEYEGLVFGNDDFHIEKADSLKKWLQRIFSIELSGNIRDQLLVAWCTYINNNKKNPNLSIWKDKGVDFALRQLERQRKENRDLLPFVESVFPEGHTGQMSPPAVVGVKMEPDIREAVSGSMEEVAILPGVLGRMPITEVVVVRPAIDTACSYIPKEHAVSGSMEEVDILPGVLGWMPITEVVVVRPAIDTACSYIPKEHAYAHIKPEPVQYPETGKTRAVKRPAESPVQTAMADEIPEINPEPVQYPETGKKRAVKRPAESPVQTAMADENPEMKPALSSDFVPEASSVKVRIVESEEASSTTRQYQNIGELSSKVKRIYIAFKHCVHLRGFRAKKEKKVLDREEEIVTLSKETASKKYKTVGDVKKEFVPVPMEITLDNVSESVKGLIERGSMPQFLREYIDTYGEPFISKLLCYRRGVISKDRIFDNLKIVHFEMSSEVVSVYYKLKSEGKLSARTGFTRFYNKVFNRFYSKSCRDRKMQYEQWLDNCLVEVERELKQELSECKRPTESPVQTAMADENPEIKPEPVQYPETGKTRAVKRPAESPVQTAMADENPEIKRALSSDFVPEASSDKVRIVESKEASSTTRQYQNIRKLSSEEKRIYRASKYRVHSMNFRAKKEKKVLDREEEIVTLSKETASKKYKTVGDVKKEFVPVPMEITLDNVSESVKKSIKKDLMPQSLRGCVDTYGELFISKLLCCYKWELISKNDTPSNLKVVPFEMSSEVVSVYDKLKSEGKLSTGTGFSDFYRNVFNPIYAKSSRDRKKQYKQWLDNCLMELKRELKQKTSGHKVIEHKVVEVGKESDVKKAEVIESSQQKSDWNIEPKPGCSWMDLS